MLRSFTLTPTGDGRRLHGRGEPTSCSRSSPEALGVDRVRVLRTPIDRMGAAARAVGRRQQLPRRLAGVVLGYERNTTTNRYLADEGIEVIPVVGSELGAAAADPRCMTCPIEREPVDGAQQTSDVDADPKEVDGDVRTGG